MKMHRSPIWFIGALLVLVSFLSEANASRADQCWASEVDPQTGLVFANQPSYDHAIQWWLTLKPPTPSIFQLAIAYDIYNSERENSLKLGSDKRAHCYMGCRIAQGTSVKTGIYVGWKKEDKDIKDCTVSTHFEVLDFEATKIGALASSMVVQTPAGCSKYCVENVAHEWAAADL